MGRAKDPSPAKLFASVITREEGVFEEGLEDLRVAFGPVDFVSQRFPFDWTDYYTKEMGKPLFRHFLSFERLIPRSSLPDVKGVTNRLEQKHSSPEGNRRLNIDPGYLCLEHVILATTKAYSHRPYLRDGIYADLTLIYREGSYRPLEWTYPDYRHPEVVSFFNDLRKTYLENLKTGGRATC